jgi:hypothetical protein
MTEASTAGSTRAAGDGTAGRLFVLDLSGGRVGSLKPDGTDRTLIATGARHPDGIAVDVDTGHIYWTNMGAFGSNDGTIERADLDGRNRMVIVPEGATHTPKQIQIDKRSGKLYWCDREGMRVMRSNLDGSNVETLVETGRSEDDRRDARNWCVGIALDDDRGQIYWTQKGPDNAGEGRIFRANKEIPEGESAADRSDIELLFDGLPEPIDLELDLDRHVLYWTDRGYPPRGDTVNRASVDAGSKAHRSKIVMKHLMEGIGLALDLPHDRMFVTDLGGSIYSARLDGSDLRVLTSYEGNLTGVAYAEIRPEAGRSPAP